MAKRTIGTVALISSATLLLSACASSGTADKAEQKTGALSEFQVSASDNGCQVNGAEAKAGAVTFKIKNTGSKVNEFYILAEDGLRIVEEKENIAPGTSVDLSLNIQPGSYFTACKPGMIGNYVGKTALKVTGERVKVTAAEKERMDKVSESYVDFVRSEVQALIPETEEFVKAYIAGEDEKAKGLYSKARVHYERIEPIAESLDNLDPRIDYRELQYIADADKLKEEDPTFTEWLGFHRIEKDLWKPAADATQVDGTPANEGWTPSDKATRKRIGETLVADVKKLLEKVQGKEFEDANEVDKISNGASDLLEEVSNNKITGEEDWWSHTDLSDFQANLQGSKIAYDLVKPIAADKSEEGKKLVAELDKQFAALQAKLDKHGSLDKGFTSYDKLSEADRKDLADSVKAVREPLNHLTEHVLGIKKEEKKEGQ